MMNHATVDAGKQYSCQQVSMMKGSPIAAYPEGSVREENPPMTQPHQIMGGAPDDHTPKNPAFDY